MEPEGKIKGKFLIVCEGEQGLDSARVMSDESQCREEFRQQVVKLMSEPARSGAIYMRIRRGKYHYTQKNALGKAGTESLGGATEEVQSPLKNSRVVLYLSKFSDSAVIDFFIEGELKGHPSKEPLLWKEMKEYNFAKQSFFEGKLNTWISAYQLEDKGALYIWAEAGAERCAEHATARRAAGLPDGPYW